MCFCQLGNGYCIMYGMDTKKLIYICIFVFSTIFGYIGALLSHGNWLSAWSIILGFVGCFVGIWVGFKLGNG
jgi:TRAP-type C4-dicarboxylate transport system permease small subunit